MDRERQTGIIAVLRKLAGPLLALAWALFAVVSWMAWRSTGDFVVLLLFCVNTLFAVLFVSRRNSTAVTDNPKDWMITAATILLSFMLRVSATENVPALMASRALQAVGVTIIIISLLSLGRSFGLVPANRGIKTKGLYTYVRHPLYSGEMLFYLGFAVGNPSLANILLMLSIFIGLHLRAGAEERLLQKDNIYTQYLKTVRFRFFPGLI